jgi:rubrerythrin
MGTKTEGNLKEAFAGESQANRKYLAFSKKAAEEGYSQVAKLFRAGLKPRPSTPTTIFAF